MPGSGQKNPRGLAERREKGEGRQERTEERRDQREKRKEGRAERHLTSRKKHQREALIRFPFKKH